MVIGVGQNKLKDMALPSIFHLAAGTPAWLLATIESALIIHIGAGGIGILSGYMAITVRKGERLHRVFGTVFFLAMLTMAAMASFMAVLIPQRGNALGGLFAMYLVATAWTTVRRKEGTLGQFEKRALPFVLALAAAYVVFGWQATMSPSGKLDGFSAGIYFVTAAVVALAGTLDLKVILRGGISGTQRIARHLWRMCVSFFFATGSFFIGQQKDMPAFMHGAPILYVLALAPLEFMIFWLIRVRLTNRFKTEAIAS
jgi:uncharacterized membrane protein